MAAMNLNNSKLNSQKSSVLTSVVLPSSYCHFSAFREKEIHLIYFFKDHPIYHIHKVLTLALC